MAIPICIELVAMYDSYERLAPSSHDEGGSRSNQPQDGNAGLAFGNALEETGVQRPAADEKCPQSRRTQQPPNLTSTLLWPAAIGPRISTN